MINYKFLVSLVFWHALLYQVNHMNKKLQIDTVVVAEGFFISKALYRNYRKPHDEGLIKLDASELVKDLNVEPVFKIRSKCLRKKENYFIINL